MIEGKKYSKKVDLWCIGVVFYELLFNLSPFQGDTVEKTRENITKKSISNSREMKNLEDQGAKELLTKLLEKNEEDRWDAEQALQSQYFENIKSCYQK